MVEVQKPEVSASVYKQYMQTHPEALQALMKVVANLYSDPLKESETLE